MNVSTQVANYLAISESQISIENDRIVIDCETARTKLNIQNCWADLTCRFCESANYLVLKLEGDRDVEYPIGNSAFRMFTALCPSV
ncbi:MULTISPECIES: hypothetical protein [unclassified Leptolyngbya]|uniref:hypothetical protein n=1 Tax=unclassified Leptolyngbya TaxID=2650499 RepID=UPI003D31CDB1